METRSTAIANANTQVECKAMFWLGAPCGISLCYEEQWDHKCGSTALQLIQNRNEKEVRSERNKLNETHFKANTMHLQLACMKHAARSTLGSVFFFSSSSYSRIAINESLECGIGLDQLFCLLLCLSLCVDFVEFFFHFLRSFFCLHFALCIFRRFRTLVYVFFLVCFGHCCGHSFCSRYQVTVVLSLKWIKFRAWCFFFSAILIVEQCSVAVFVQRR